MCKPAIETGPPAAVQADGKVTMADSSPIRRAQSCAADARQAVREFHAAVQQPEMALVLFFCSSQYALDEVADEMKRLFAGVLVAGCTTAAEIGPAGHRVHSLSGASFAKAGFEVAGARIDDLRNFELAPAQALIAKTGSPLPSAAPMQRFALLLIDGLAQREEQVARVLQAALGSVPLVGGSAADDLAFADARVFWDGGFQAGSAVLLLGATVLPFKVFSTQDVVAGERRLVVTRADAASRRALQIDGRPAVQAYADLVGVPVHELGPSCFATSPLAVLIEGSSYVRAIRSANADGSLSFHSAIEEGLVLRLARSVDMVQNLAQCMASIRAEIGPPQLLIGFDCILRRFEMQRQALAPAIEALLRDNSSIGFGGYGEQYWGVHVNQTLSGIAFGDASGPAHHG